MSNPTGKGGFQERKHHINRKGRPKSFDALRALARQISHEEAQSGGQPIVINGHTVTVAEAMLRQLAQSKNPKDRQLFLEIAYGKVPNPLEVTGKDGGPVATEIIIKYADDNDPPAASGATPDTQQREAV